MASRQLGSAYPFPMPMAFHVTYSQIRHYEWTIYGLSMAAAGDRKVDGQVEQLKAPRLKWKMEKW